MSKQTVIVTGAGSGIGRATAVAFAERGADLVLVGRNAEALQQSAKLVQARGATCLAHSADVGDAAAVAGMVEAAVARFGRVDVLVNNAALGPRARIEEMELATFDAMLAVNAAGVFYACKAVWPVMLRQQGGTIVNISSMAAADPYPGLGIYGATKAFVNALTRGLAEEGKSCGILVFAVGPGAVETKMLRASFPKVPAEQVLPPEAIADMVVNLTTPACRHSSGQTIYVRR